MNSLETTIVFIILVLIDLCPSVIVYLAAVLTLPSPAVSGSVSNVNVWSRSEGILSEVYSEWPVRCDHYYTHSQILNPFWSWDAGGGRGSPAAPPAPAHNSSDLGAQSVLPSFQHKDATQLLNTASLAHIYGDRRAEWFPSSLVCSKHGFKIDCQGGCQHARG